MHPSQDRKSTRLNSSHPSISYAVFCLKKKITLLDGALGFLFSDLVSSILIALSPGYVFRFQQISFDLPVLVFTFFFFNDTATTEIYTLSLHDALPICVVSAAFAIATRRPVGRPCPE